MPRLQKLVKNRQIDKQTLKELQVELSLIQKNKDPINIDFLDDQSHTFSSQSEEE